jgi:hypothetical protein
MKLREPKNIVHNGKTVIEWLEYNKKQVADLSVADLSGADLSGADLSVANLSGANLSGANLSGADLRGANLSGADLGGANLGSANLRGADLSGADLGVANLSGADLSGADLRGADLRGADLRGADLRGANLSGAQGLRDAAKWMKENFLHNELGYIVYKAIGNTSYSAPSYWKLGVIGEWLEEVVNPNRQDDCGCGVNIGTLEWVRNNYPDARYFELLVPWEDAAGIVVPYNTTGKARCARALQVREVT